MIHTRRTDSNDPGFRALVNELDGYLLSRYGALQQVYSPYNKIENLPTVVVVYAGQEPAGCACFKNFETGTVEVKRMFVRPDFRGKGMGGILLDELEKWAVELGHQALVLELGNKQPEALRLYQGKGYRVIPNYGQYAGLESSICMKKQLRAD
jgi:putative acetyltransferase